MSIGGHQSPRAKTVSWITPPEILSALGEFDLDPCTCDPQPWPSAKEMWTTGGLERDWHGRAWVNPPYGREAALWLDRLSEHGNGIALTFARTETRMFFDSVWPTASALLFIRGRLHFHYPDGKRAAANSGAPSVLIAYGQDCARVLGTCGISGALVGAASIL